MQSDNSTPRIFIYFLVFINIAILLYVILKLLNIIKF